MIEQQYEVPVEGGPPIVLMGVQEYSPGQTSKCDAWILQVPVEHKGRIFHDLEYRSFAEALKAIAKAFFDGDEDKTRAAMTSRGSNADRA